MVTCPWFHSYRPVCCREEVLMRQKMKKKSKERRSRCESQFLTDELMNSLINVLVEVSCSLRSSMVHPGSHRTLSSRPRFQSLWHIRSLRICRFMFCYNKSLLSSSGVCFFHSLKLVQSLWVSACRSACEVPRTVTLASLVCWLWTQLGVLVVSDGSESLVGAGDSHRWKHPAGGAVDLQPDWTHQTRDLPGPPHSHHPLRRGGRHRTHHHIQPYVWHCVVQSPKGSVHPNYNKPVTDLNTSDNSTE